MTTRQIAPRRLDQARRLRRNQTPAEERLWSGLRGRRLQGHKFIRQHSVGPFTVDFLCREAANRVLRILNDDVFHRFNDVMDMILLAIADKLPPD